jgi:hypothetical protein
LQAAAMILDVAEGGATPQFRDRENDAKNDAKDRQPEYEILEDGRIFRLDSATPCRKVALIKIEQHGLFAKRHDAG